EPVVIVGHSIGAAAALACSPSPQVAGLVLVNPLGFVSMHHSSGSSSGPTRTLSRLVGRST
uniref:alpha/beta hydrolase n=1 Tax=Rhodococcus qingshengii TaxID=334542 RepID=UPI001C4DF1A8